MKAKVIDTGEIVDVRQASVGDSYFIDGNSNPYKVVELDFNVEQERKSNMSDEQFGFINFIQGQAEKELREVDKTNHYRDLRGSILVTLLENRTQVMSEDELLMLAKWADSAVRTLMEFEK